MLNSPLGAVGAVEDDSRNVTRAQIFLLGFIGKVPPKRTPPVGIIWCLRATLDTRHGSEAYDLRSSRDNPGRAGRFGEASLQRWLAPTGGESIGRQRSSRREGLLPIKPEKEIFEQLLHEIYPTPSGRVPRIVTIIAREGPSGGTTFVDRDRAKRLIGAARLALGLAAESLGSDRIETPDPIVLGDRLPSSMRFRSGYACWSTRAGEGTVLSSSNISD